MNGTMAVDDNQRDLQGQEPGFGLPATTHPRLIVINPAL
jgi:hypothetical protein